MTGKINSLNKTVARPDERYDGLPFYKPALPQNRGRSTPEGRKIGTSVQKVGLNIGFKFVVGGLKIEAKPSLMGWSNAAKLNAANDGRNKRGTSSGNAELTLRDNRFVNRFPDHEYVALLLLVVIPSSLRNACQFQIAQQFDPTLQQHP